MTSGQRVKLIRKELGLTLEKFGDKLGVTKQTISRIENNINNLTEQLAKSICREFKVNYVWLTEGTGEMFSNLPETLLDEVSEEYNLDDMDKLLVKRYMELSSDKRNVIKEYLQSVFIPEKNGE